MNGSVVKSAGRVFEVLELFDIERVALTATSIARTLKYPASSTVALLKSMVQLGYLIYDTSERVYFPSIRTAAVSHWFEETFLPDCKLFDLVKELTQTTGENVYLSWQNDLEMQCVTVHAGPSSGTPGDEMRSSALFGSVVGLMALSQKRDVDIVKIAERLNHMKRKIEPQIDVAAAMEQIRTFRTQTYGIGNDDESGLGTMAWVLKQKNGKRLLVLAVRGPSNRIKAKEKAIVQNVRTALQRFGGA
jgi:IclR family KDG regulon transcriptional repressor